MPSSAYSNCVRLRGDRDRGPCVGLAPRGPVLGVEHAGAKRGLSARPTTSKIFTHRSRRWYRLAEGPGECGPRSRGWRDTSGRERSRHAEDQAARPSAPWCWRFEALVTSVTCAVPAREVPGEPAVDRAEREFAASARSRGHIDIEDPRDIVVAEKYGMGKPVFSRSIGPEGASRARQRLGGPPLLPDDGVWIGTPLPRARPPCRDPRLNLVGRHLVWRLGALAG